MKIIITSIVVAVAFLIIAFGIISSHEPRGALTKTEFMETGLVKNRILDWINEKRAEKNLRAINMDAKLSEIAYKEAVRIANADSAEFEAIENQDDNKVVKSYGYDCIGNDNKSLSVRGVGFGSEHTRYPDDLEPFVEYYMKFVVSDSEPYDIIFNPDASKIGIGIAMSSEKFYVLQFFCGV